MRKIDVSKARRSYNGWVANETLEDYALRFTAKASRKWSELDVANTALGAVSFLALEAIGATIAIKAGFDNAILALSVVTLIIFLTSLPISYYAAKYGVDIDLLTRGAGFGYIGSTLTSLIYASFTFIFFALEAAIMASALNLLFGVSVEMGYLISAVVIIPVVAYGITLISRFQLLTQPIWLILQVLPIVYVLFNKAGDYFTGGTLESSALSHSSQGISLLLFGAASGVLFSLIAQIGEQVDYLRFLPEPQQKNRFRWWMALIAAGPGWILIGAAKIAFGCLLALFALEMNYSVAQASDPVYLYLMIFSQMIKDPSVALAVTGLFVILCQLKINVTNAYAGSIAWSNFFSRLTHSHPGRVVWLMFNVLIALIIAELGAYHALEKVLGVYSNVAVAWVAALVADLVINKPLGMSPKGIEFKRAHLFDINPVGFGAMILGSCFGIFAYVGLFGEVTQALSQYLAFLIAFLLSPLIAYITKSRYYIARTPRMYSAEQQQIVCEMCQNAFDTEDMAYCPAYSINICSLCCTLDALCHDECKEESKFVDQIARLTRLFLPRTLHAVINVRLIQFFSLLTIINLLIAALFWFVYQQVLPTDIETQTTVANMMIQVYLLLIIITGILTWLFVLAQESRELALKESQQQTKLLSDEIRAHEKTDLELQKAKEQAEAANNAKSRYLSGLSHEMRTPLNSILGYAQLLEKNTSLEPHVIDRLKLIRKSGDHLEHLIEGLLDISAIESGRLHISRDIIFLNDLLDELADNSRFEASKKGLEFIYHKSTMLPKAVYGDKKHLKQILINLLNNAIKYTDRGWVKLQVRYRNQVAEFAVSDSGIGISKENQERIFQPFERVLRSEKPQIPGSGLGLTISKLLADVMGGDLYCDSERAKGSVFKLSLMMSEAWGQHLKQNPSKQGRVMGYHGPQKRILVVDDNRVHRGLLLDILKPIGFDVYEAQSSETAMSMMTSMIFDVWLIDINMPGMNGLELAMTIQRRDSRAKIIMISADATEKERYIAQFDPAAQPYYAYLTKPIKEALLLEVVQNSLQLSWTHEPSAKAAHLEPLEGFQSETTRLSIETLSKVKNMAMLGYADGVLRMIDKATSIYGNQPEIYRIRDFAEHSDFNNLIILTNYLIQSKSGSQNE